MRILLISLLFVSSLVAEGNRPVVRHRPALEAGWSIPEEQSAFPIKPAPVFYPEEAIAAGQGAMVWVRAHVQEDGHVDSAEVAYSNNPNYGFEEAAKVATLKAEFDSTMFKGWVYVPFDFFPDSSLLPALPLPNEYVYYDQQPEMVREREPEYPWSAKQAGIEGTVWLKVLVDAEGRVNQAQVARTSGNKDLDKAAIKAARSNVFDPAKSNGTPVAVWVTYKISFQLGH